jgi:beta-1,2-mannobiose phosphorylase / 1,2-beta-oligomannan phosphorylase
MIPFQLQRLGLVMEPEPGNPLEAEGVLNPAAARGPDGQLYLFPRLVASGCSTLSVAFYERFSSCGDADFANKGLCAMRHEFIGHLEEAAAKWDI